MLLNVPIPMTALSFYGPSESKKNLKVMDAFYDANKAMLDTISEAVNVPVDLILSFCYIESECKNAKPRSSKGAVGYMQIDSETATDTINREVAKKRLSDKEKELLRKHLGAQLDTIIRTKPQTGVISQAKLQIKEFNILIATMYLGQLIDAHTENGIVRLDKVVVRYNRGINTKPTGSTAEAIMEYARNKWRGLKGQITVDYVKKLVGKHGLLETLMNASL